MLLDMQERYEDLFDSLGKEQREPEDLRIKVTRNERLEKIVKVFEELLMKEDTIDEYYNEILRIIQIIPSAKEILDFSILMGDYQDFKNFDFIAGHYLSALVNKSNEYEIIINTNHLEKLLNCIGYKNNGKIIKINGDMGSFLGELMQSGTIHAENAGNFLGYFLDGGTIYAENSGKFVGGYMRGGTIHIENTYQSLSDEIHGGNIYHQGKLIVKDGKRIT
jgi:hypothetical protein